ncbi:MAG: NAD(P)(+) transhydrogenase (Re/Si-specific) subunit beta, partial [Neisseriaceae bacterium]|nr:NAD(P)(+) transhydrogenase (Re/Si-specific) subunit beta [Neisseriaceae bacterium]
MATGIVTSAYIIAAIFFILALAGLSKQETAKNGNMFGMIGMAIALIATICSEDVNGLIWIIIAMLGGAIVGIYKAKKVEMTQMPELIALLHSFVGLTAVLVGFNSFIQSDMLENPDMETVHLIEVFLGVFIGAVTFTGSIVAWGKLKGTI